MHSVASRVIIQKVAKGDALSILVSGQADLVKPIKARKYRLQLFLSYVLRDVAHVQRNGFFSRCLASVVLRYSVHLVLLP